MKNIPKILVVEADRNASLSFAAAFHQRGWEVVSASDATLALNVARKEQPDLIVLNSRLPGGGGVTALKRIRACVHTAVIPVIGLTERASPQRQELLAAGAQECLEKPVDIEALCGIIRRRLDQPLTVVEAPAYVICDLDRLAALEHTRLLDSEPDEFLNRLVQLASRLLGAPTALLSLVDKDRQYFKSQIGLGEPWAKARQTPLSHSFCQWVVAGEEYLTVSDARQHAALRSNLAIRDLGVIAYAGMPVVTLAGKSIGSFCAIDSKPHSWTEDDLETLRDLSHVVEAHIALQEPTLHPASAAEVDQSARMLADRMQAVTNAIRGATGVLRRGGSRLGEPERNQLLAIVHRQCEHMSRLIADLRWIPSHQDTQVASCLP
jgi:DNA-binding response OmpR family regulator